MHIPENYLSPSTCAVMTIAMTPVWIRAIRKVREEVPRERIPLLGIGAAFSFVGMMFNIPLPGGTTGHAVGGTLIALLLGPDAACLSVSIALLIQALLFGDGGILAYGANCFNMAFLLPYIGYGLYRLVKGRSASDRLTYLAAGIGSYAGINAAAFFAALEFGIQPMLFKNAAGQALYCPYDLSISIPSMMIGHLTIFGAAEVLFTVAVYSFIRKTSPSIIHRESRTPSVKPLLILLAVLTACVPAGLLAQGTAWGEWGAEEIASIVSGGSALGYTPSGMESGFSLAAIMPDYTLAGLPDAAAYILSALIGIALSVIVFRLIAAGMKQKTNFSQV